MLSRELTYSFFMRLCELSRYVLLLITRKLYIKAFKKTLFIVHCKVRVFVSACCQALRLAFAFPSNFTVVFSKIMIFLLENILHLKALITVATVIQPIGCKIFIYLGCKKFDFNIFIYAVSFLVACR